ncbi:hypothetical protein BU17DRAFT_61102 [Hysterangium stoloniferum]|nr:hypothetical protein BU17DRAFT_61102 [Hysterangium stoloniferum]
MWPAGHYVPQTTDAPEDSVDGWMQTESIENEDIVLFLTLALCPPTPAQPPAARFPRAASAQHRRTCLSRSATATATANTTPPRRHRPSSRISGPLPHTLTRTACREALMMGAGRATPPPPFDAPGNPGAGPGPGDSLTSLRLVGDGDGEEAGMVTVPQSLGQPSLEAAGEDGSGPAAAETPVGGRMSLSSGAGAGEKTLDSDDMSGDTSLASIMDASISTPETTFTVGHPPPDVSKDTPVPLSLALYIPGVPATAAAKSAPTPPPTPPSQHSHSQRQSSSSHRLSVPVITVAPNIAGKRTRRLNEAITNVTRDLTTPDQA